ncbi:MAG: helix-turn-helix domain-containing protein [Balneolales bacterium]
MKKDENSINNQKLPSETTLEELEEQAKKDPKNLKTIQETADLYGITKDDVWAMISNGDLPEERLRVKEPTPEEIKEWEKNKSIPEEAIRIYHSPFSASPEQIAKNLGLDVNVVIEWVDNGTIDNSYVTKIPKK